MNVQIIKAQEEPVVLLQCKKFADLLTTYLTNRNESFVINIDADWGMGKTFSLTH